jgi:hypothetical protein
MDSKNTDIYTKLFKNDNDKFVTDSDLIDKLRNICNETRIKIEKNYKFKKINVFQYYMNEINGKDLIDPEKLTPYKHLHLTQSNNKNVYITYINEKKQSDIFNCFIKYDANKQPIACYSGLE